MKMHILFHIKLDKYTYKIMDFNVIVNYVNIKEITIKNTKIMNNI